MSSQIPMLPYTAVVATYERPEDLRLLFDSLLAQTRPPAAVVVVDSSPTPPTEQIARDYASRLPLRYERARKPSAAVQRNQGAESVSTPLVAFIDDDAVLAPDCFAKICAAFEADAEGRIGGIAARIVGMSHTPPRGLLRWYYRLQAGYDHPTYGGKMFGPAINCLPAYEHETEELIPSDWLNSTCVCYRTPLFAREQFPIFEGYSFLEDAHLSARIGRTHQLFFHRTASFEHHDAPSIFKKNARALARMRVRHRRILAHDIMDLREPVLSAKLFLHRLFASVAILRGRAPGWREELLGTWT